jgi:hypothetical protein
MVGNRRHNSVKAPDKIEKLKLRTVTNRAYPKSPKIIEGTPARVSIP